MTEDEMRLLKSHIVSGQRVIAATRKQLLATSGLLDTQPPDPINVHARCGEAIRNLYAATEAIRQVERAASKIISARKT